jgi:hypothetical protein
MIARQPKAVFAPFDQLVDRVERQSHGPRLMSSPGALPHGSEAIRARKNTRLEQPAARGLHDRVGTPCLAESRCSEQGRCGVVRESATGQLMPCGLWSRI